MGDLIALAERIEALDGPCRETDAEIAVAVSDAPDARIVWAKGYRWFRKPGPGRIPMPGAFGKGCRLGLYFQTVRYTASLDAALTLAPEMHSWSLSVGGCAIAQVTDLTGGPCDVPPDYEGHAANPALALCAAALRARAGKVAG